MIRRAPMRAGSRGLVGFAAVVIAIGLAAGCGSSDDTTSAADETTETTGTTTDTNSGSSTGETSTSGGCPVGGSGQCTMSIRCPEGDYDLEIGRLDATTAIVVAARPAVAPPATSTTTTTTSTDTTPTDSTPTASTPTPPPALGVGKEVAARLDRDEAGQAAITTLCADGVTAGAPAPGG